MSLSQSCRVLRRPAATSLGKLYPRNDFLSESRYTLPWRRLYASSNNKKDESSDTPRPTTQSGMLAESSIFRQAAQSASASVAEDSTPPKVAENPGRRSTRSTRALAVDPDPEGREAFERKMTIREVRSRGRLSRAAALKRTERQYMGKSQYHRTGYKKVNALARQIAGKTIDEAITQMEFSKKRAAMWIKDHLVHAKNMATVERGMNLGESSAKNDSSVEDESSVEQKLPRERQGQPWTRIRLKDGSPHVIKDPTSMYVAQAWVNQGSSTEVRVVKRARSKFEQQPRPATNIAVLLKEETTRMREHKERIEKRDRQKPWEHLPNKPINGQRPYYTW